MMAKIVGMSEEEIHRLSEKTLRLIQTIALKNKKMKAEEKIYNVDQTFKS